MILHAIETITNFIIIIIIYNNNNNNNNNNNADDVDDDDEPVKGVEILLYSSLAYGYCVFLGVRPNFRVLSVDEIGCKRSLKAWCLVRRWKNAGKCSSSDEEKTPLLDFKEK